MTIFTSGMLFALALLSTGWFCSRNRNGSVGLPVAYLSVLSITFVPGALVHMDGKYVGYPFVWVEAGFAMAAIGALCFVAGVVAVDFLGMWKIRPKAAARVPLTHLNPSRLMMLGLGVWLVVLPLLPSVPSLTAVLAGFAQITVVALILGILSAKERKDKSAFYGWIALLFVMPLMTTAMMGFLGFGAMVVVTVLVTLLTYEGAWKKALPFLPLVVYVAMSVFVTYLRDRGDLREVVWSGGGMQARAAQLADSFARFEWFDTENMQHRRSLDERLNQGWLCGFAKERLSDRSVDHGGGKLIIGGITAMIPRAFWPDKPVVGGGGDVVASYLGIEFAEGTSVGATQVFEFYADFGWAGLVLGFVLLGMLIRFVDSKAASFLRAGDWRAFLFWYLPGLALLQAGGNLSELTSSFVANFVAAWLVIKVIFPRLKQLPIRSSVDVTS